MIAEGEIIKDNTNNSQITKSGDNDPLVWEKNKLEMIKILKKAPIVGVYKNQDPSQWNNFFKFYVDFLNSEVGPRGVCAKKIRQQLKQNKQIVDQVLKPYNLSHSMHIRSIYVRFKFLIPCRQYHEYNTTLQSLEKTEQSIFRLKQPDHPMYLSIKNGMIKKHGPQYPYQEEIVKLQSNYQMKLQRLYQDKILYEQKLKNMEEYQNYIRMNSVMKKWFDEWVQADSCMGKESCNRGQAFQDKVLQNVIPEIMKRQTFGVFNHLVDKELLSPQNIERMILQATQNSDKKNKNKKLHLFVNMRWKPRDLGEIDITIAQYIEQTLRYEARVLIQCKARLFDVRQASYQVFTQFLKLQNKVQLSGKYGPVYVDDNVTSYIVTTLPDFQFVLPIESDLKATLDRNSKDKPIEQITQVKLKDIMFEQCSKRFGMKLSPFEWFMQSNSPNIIILSRQT